MKTTLFNIFKTYFTIIFFIAFALFSNKAISKPDKRIAILYASIGNGHKAAALTIKKQIALKDKTIIVDVIDVFDFAPKWVGSSINYLYNLTTQNTPGLYDWHFNTQVDSLSKLNSLGDSINASRFFYGKNLIKHLQSLKPDIIFSTFNHTTEGLIALKNKNSKLIIASTLTDYVPHKYYKK